MGEDARKDEHHQHRLQDCPQHSENRLAVTDVDSVGAQREEQFAVLVESPKMVEEIRPAGVRGTNYKRLDDRPRGHRIRRNSKKATTG
jgi:hypothetical protein